MENIKTIIIGSDHAGFELKVELSKYLKGIGYKIIDNGALTLDPEDDYPDFIYPVARMVAGDAEHCRGIVVGASGEGEAIVANRVKGIRAAEYYGGNTEIIKLSREHNDSNILSLGARFITAEEAKDAVLLWLNTPFSKEERHIRRIEKIDK
ncbi:MAG: RpiB/LacA/LacB family sugar-phosphate isomerase [Candidatus Taylorbacteria bacterium]|nr:RpiB/LacA/LacB family sugar-phosphate isomerase [Candidatus Taylorbacteria bacterium]